MAVLHMDDFSGYGTNVDLLLAGVYAQAGETNISGFGVSLTADPDGVSPGRVLRMNNGYGGGGNYRILRKVLPNGAVAVVGVMLRVWLPVLPTLGRIAPISLLDGSANSLYTLTVTSTGALEIRDGDHNGTVLYTSALPEITAQGWYHIEWKAVIDPASGSFEVRVEGLPVAGLVQSEINTGSTSVAQIGNIQDSDNTSAGHDYFIKDYVIWDASGSDVTDFVGTCILNGHTLTEDVDLNWTPVGEATGIAILNRIPPDPDFYIYAPDDPLPAPYQADFSPLPEDVVSVKAVMVRYMAAKNDGGDASVQSALVSDPDGTADVVLGANRNITIAQTFWSDIYHRDPKTDAPWLPASLNEANVLFDRTT